MKPFNLEQAKAGKPLVIRHGGEAKFIGHFPDNEEFERVAFIHGGQVSACSESGRFSKYDEETCLDLFMAEVPRVKREGFGFARKGAFKERVRTSIEDAKGLAASWAEKTGEDESDFVFFKVEWEEEA